MTMWDNKCPICGKPSVDAIDIHSGYPNDVWRYWMRCDQWHEWRYKIIPMMDRKSIVELEFSQPMSKEDVEWYKRFGDEKNG